MTLRRANIALDRLDRSVPAEHRPALCYRAAEAVDKADARIPIDDPDGRRRRSAVPSTRLAHMFHRSPAVTAACGLLAVAAAAAAQSATREIATGPRAIRSYQLLVPHELAGSDIHPEVEVRVEIDAVGTVSRVEVLAIEPSSEFDDLLRSQVKRRVGGWRYGPARDKEGNAVPSTLSWWMKFQSPEEERNAPRRKRFDPQLDILVSAGALPDPIPQSTLSEQAKVLNRTIGVAEKYIDREHRKRWATKRFILISDAEDDSTVQILAGNMEAVFRSFHELFDPHIEPLPHRFKVVVYLFSSRHSLRRLQEELGGRVPGAGFYHSPGLLAFHREVRYFDELLHTMLHEAFHAFSDTYLTGPGSELPRWAEEGMAEYFGNSKVERGELIPGAVDRGRYAISHGGNGPVRLQSLTIWNLEEARSALRKGEAPRIADLMEATADTFYGVRAQHYYGFSWLLTHFLQHGRKNWETDQSFARMLLYLAEGYASRDALAAVFGTTPAELQAEFERYVLRL